ncbi:MAG: transcriptional repressor NrdR [Chloroflexi bacterium]|nr:transcriptional repressor NrdR [Chloroflexota bacterium]
MRCPSCGHEDSKVVDSRNAGDGIRRRRQCLSCSSRFTTYERTQATNMLVIKKDGRREEFSREKMASGLRKACAKRPVSQEAIEQLVDDIEAQLHQLGKGEVATTIIGDMVMDRLRQLDGVAYIRFASVYRAFADIEELKQEADAYERLKLLRNSKSQLPLFSNEELNVIAHGVADRGKQPGESAE